jgi:hypothetical protein
MMNDVVNMMEGIELGYGPDQPTFCWSCSFLGSLRS